MERRIAELDKDAKAAAEKVQPLKAKQPGCYRWEAELPAPLELILAGEVLFLGGDGEVLAVSVKDGKQLWSAKVEGKAYGIAFSGGNLFVSTGLGHIYCFGS
jgi:outer membrane protein assembly factor BamB